MRAKARQLQTELHEMMLEDKSMRKFFLRIKEISNLLAFVESSISLQEHINAILEGLSQDYHSVISVIDNKFQPLPVEEVEVLLLAHEARLLKF